MGKSLSRFSNEIAELAMQVRHSTVTIICMSPDLSSGGSGSGWIFDHDGHVVTNCHVIAGAGSIQVKPSGLPPLTSHLIGFDESTDLAVLHVDGLTRPPLDIRHGFPILGELCLALGSPLGFQESVSMGVVSGLSRQLPTQNGQLIEEAVQTDASINPGNSGGPLVDASGFVIGVNTAVRNDAQNMGFAVSSEVVLDVIPELLGFGEVKRASLGISIASEWVSEGGHDSTRISVKRVQREDSPFRQGDILETIDGHHIERRYDVRKILNRSRIDVPTEVVVQRGGRFVGMTVVPLAA